MAGTPSFDADGWMLQPAAVPPDGLAVLATEIEAAVGQGGAAHGMRDVLRRSPAARAWADRLASIARLALASDPRLIRGLLLDKTAAANWHVPWHQDVTITLAERRPAPGFTNWTVKQGVVHAQPPEPWASRRVAVRVHLDPCPADAGPLQVLPGTHRGGVLDDAAIVAHAAQVAPVSMITERGEVLVMHPLLLHASARAQRPGRRVLHLEYVDATVPLPQGLAWAESD